MSNLEKNTADDYTVALLRSLQFSGVKFIRFFALDAFGTIRCKATPIEVVLASKTFQNQVSVAAVCFAGLPPYADMMIAGTGMDAKNVLKLQPDMSSLRILPYASKTAMIMAYAVDQYTNMISPLCTRGLLKRVVQEAAQKHNTAFSIGAELEFCLIHADTKDPVAYSVFASTITLNDQESFLVELCDQLQQQDIPVELVHAESGPGQLEVVLQCSNDPIAMADNIVLCRETIRAVARQFGLQAIFTPKYDMMAAGNGMHLHFSTRDASTHQPNFCNASALTDVGASFLEGILSHLAALMGITLPTVNSFRRVGPGCWTGSAVGWATEDKECGVRVCSDLATCEWRHFELKFIDHTCNIYLAMAAVLFAGLQGIENSMTLREPLHKDSSPTPLPSSVFDALDALENDNYLTALLSPPLTQAYLAVRRHDAERASTMTFDDEVKDFSRRS